MINLVGKNKYYTSLSIVVCSENYQELLGCKANSNILLRNAFPHLRISNGEGNVKKTEFQMLYKQNDFLSSNDLVKLKKFIDGSTYDAITFIVPDPREIIENPHDWYKLLKTVNPFLRQNAYITGYEKHFKVNDIVRSLAQVSGSSLTLNKLPKTNCPQADDTIDDFNDSIYTANNDFYYDGSVIPERVRF